MTAPTPPDKTYGTTSSRSSQETLVAKEPTESSAPPIHAKSSVHAERSVYADSSDPPKPVPAGSSVGAGSSAPGQRSFATQLINTVTDLSAAWQYYRRSKTARSYPWSKYPDNYQEMSAAAKMKSNCPVVGVGFGPSTCRPILVPVYDYHWPSDPDEGPEYWTSQEMLELKIADKLGGWKTNVTDNELCEAMRTGGPSAVQDLLKKTVSEQKFSKVDLVYLGGAEWQEELQQRDVDTEDPEATALRKIWGPATGLYNPSKEAEVSTQLPSSTCK